MSMITGGRCAFVEAAGGVASGAGPGAGVAAALAFLLCWARRTEAVQVGTRSRPGMASATSAGMKV